MLEEISKRNERRKILKEELKHFNIEKQVQYGQIEEQTYDDVRWLIGEVERLQEENERHKKAYEYLTDCIIDEYLGNCQAAEKILKAGSD